MVKDVYIDCEKWQKVIGIILWSATTFGLAWGEYCIVSYIQTDKFDACILSYSELTRDENGRVVSTTCADPSAWRVFDPAAIVGLIFGSAANFFNTLFIWRVINSHYGLVRFHCGKKPGVNL